MIPGHKYVLVFESGNAVVAAVPDPDRLYWHPSVEEFLMGELYCVEQWFNRVLNGK